MRGVYSMYTFYKSLLDKLNDVNYNVRGLKKIVEDRDNDYFIGSMDEEEYLDALSKARQCKRKIKKAIEDLQALSERWEERM